MTRDLRSLLEEFGDDEGRAVVQASPDPTTQARTLAARVRRRWALWGSGAAAAAVALAVGGSALLDGLPDRGQALPALSPIPSTTRSAAPTPTPTSTPTAVQPTATPDPPGTPEPPVTPVLELGPGGSVAGFGPDADAAQVVAHLSELFGGPPQDESGTEVQGLVTVSGFACSTNRRPGAYLSWGDFALIVRTDDDARTPVPPYVAGWVTPSYLTDLSVPPRDDLTTVDLRTAEGVRRGDPLSTLQAAYPGLRGPLSAGPGPEVRLWFTEQGDREGVRFMTDAVDGAAEHVVTSLSGGYSCGE